MRKCQDWHMMFKLECGPKKNSRIRAERLISQPCDSSWKQQSWEAETLQAWQAAGSCSPHQLHREESPGNQMQELGWFTKTFFMKKFVQHQSRRSIPLFRGWRRSSPQPSQTSPPAPSAYSGLSCEICSRGAALSDSCWHRDTVKRIYFSYWETASGRLISKPTLLSACLKISQTCFKYSKTVLALKQYVMSLFWQK